MRRTRKGCNTITRPDYVYFPNGSSRTVDLEELYVDPLTGLGNLFSCLVELNMYGEASTSGSEPFFLALVDVDRFAAVNERIGTSASDQVLLVAKASLLDTLGTVGKIYRFASDSFAAVGRASPDHLIRSADELRVTFCDRCADVLEADCPITLSVGGTVVMRKSSLGEILLCANRALHLAKDRGGNAVEMAPSPSGRTVGRESPAGSMLSVFGGQILETLDIIADVGKMAMTDPLTGLPNQRAAELHLRKMLSAPDEDTFPVSILLIDGDRLKEHNTRYGYSGGNAMMMSLADTLESSKRSSDFLARWFVGDEFLVVLPGTDAVAARRVAERMKKRVKDATRSWEIPVTVSIGTATSTGDRVRIADLVTSAQQACLAAKERGKDTVVMYSELDDDEWHHPPGTGPGTSALDE